MNHQMRFALHHPYIAKPTSNASIRTTKSLRLEALLLHYYNKTRTPQTAMDGGTRTNFIPLENYCTRVFSEATESGPPQDEVVHTPKLFFRPSCMC
mmetsp:Transcript_51245/g.85628  ORF Transcript_51245/g.85628 Transcript_51245/m.85628 type:complete len:96 (+) Transcript_51245:142-429(+)